MPMRSAECASYACVFWLGLWHPLIEIHYSFILLLAYQCKSRTKKTENLHSMNLYFHL